jgi:hypothetical protein
MAHPHIADGRKDKTWRVTANILNKELWTDDMGWFSSLGTMKGC